MTATTLARPRLLNEHDPEANVPSAREGGGVRFGYMDDPPEPGTFGIGALVRKRRLEHGLTQPELGQIADMGRTTLHRIENEVGTQARPANLARVLRALNITRKEVTTFLGPDQAEYADYVISWMDRLERTQEMGDWLAGQQEESEREQDAAADVTLLHPDGTLMLVQVKSKGNDHEAALEAIIECAKTAGMTAMRPL